MGIPLLWETRKNEENPVDDWDPISRTVVVVASSTEILEGKPFRARDGRYTEQHNLNRIDCEEREV